jgi:predicted nucleotidyltransferase
VTKDQILALLKQNLAYLSTEYGVKRIGVFGSYTRGRPTDESDVDIVVEFERPIGFRFVEFAEYLERLLDREVDVLTPAGIQGIRIAHVGRDIAESIEYV